MPISNAIHLRGTTSPVALRSRVWLRRRHLDRLLAAGASPEETPELSHRALQLASPACRRGVAVSLERVLDAAEEPARGLTAQAPLQRREILAASLLLREIASELRDAERVNPRGVAMAERLLTNGTSPLYSPAEPETLESSLRHIRAALLLA